MKVIDIALKDMTQSFRNMFAIMFMFVVPILMTGMFYIMLGGSGEDGEGFVLPITKAVIVNQDRGSFTADMPEGFSQNPGGADSTSLGDLVTQALQSEDFAEVMDVTILEDEEDAREAVDNQEAGVAVILPENLTDSFIAPEGGAVIEIYQDPTLTIGPSIVKGIISQFLDRFAGAKITLEVTIEQLSKAGVPVSEEQIQGMIAQYLQISQTRNAEIQSGEISPFLEIRAPRGEETSFNPSIGIIAMIMTGMTVFYVFFTGASSAQSILREEERGTLPRLFTTPTPQSTIMAGKFLAVASIIVVQVLVLMSFGYLVFNIQWGELASVILMSIAIVIASAAFGIFLISWIRTERQAGFVIGGLVTILGMMGMMPIFVMGAPNPPAFITILSRFVPQGWAVDGLQKVMLGGGLPTALPNVVVLLIWGAVFLIIDIARFRNRYA